MHPKDLYSGEVHLRNIPSVPQGRTLVTDPPLNPLVPLLHRLTLVTRGSSQLHGAGMRDEDWAPFETRPRGGQEADER